MNQEQIKKIADVAKSVGLSDVDAMAVVLAALPRMAVTDRRQPNMRIHFVDGVLKFTKLQ